MFKEYDVIQLKVNLPKFNLRKGDSRTIVMIYATKPQFVCEVEFVDSEGITTASTTLEEKDFEKIENLSSFFIHI